MRFYENKELHLKLVKLLFQKLIEKNPKKYQSILTDEKALEVVNNEENIERYKRTVKINEEYLKGREQCENLRNDEKINVLHGITRATMDTFKVYNSDAEKEERVAELKELENTLGATKKATQYFGNLLDKNFFEADFMNTDEVISKYEENPGIYNLGFVTNQMISEISGSRPNAEFKEIINHSKIVFEMGGTYKNVVMKHSNPYILLLPQEVDPNDLPEIMTETKELLSPIIAENKIEDFTFGNNPVDSTLNDYLTNTTAVKKDAVESAKLKNELAKAGITNTKDLVIGYNFKDKEGKTVHLNEVCYSITEENKHIEDYQVIKNTEEEKNKILENFKKPYVYSLSIDKDAKERLVNTVFSDLKEAFPGRDDFEEAKAQAIINDESRYEIHEKAKTIQKVIREQDYMVKSIIRDKKIHLDPGFARYARFLMKGNRGNGPQMIENAKLLQSFTSREKAQEFLNGEMNKLSQIDLSECIFKDPKDYINNYSKFENLRMAFILNSVVENGHYQISNEFKEFMNNNKSLFESFSIYENAASYYANDAYPYLPDSFKPTTTEEIIKYNQTVTASINKMKKESVDFSDKSDAEITGMVNDLVQDKQIVDMNQEFLQTVSSEIEKGNISKFAFKDNYIKDKDDNTVSFEKYINEVIANKENKEYSVGTYTKSEKAKLDSVLEKPLMNYDGDLLKTIVSNKDDILAELEKIENAKAKISFFNSPQYNNLTSSISEFKELLSNPKLDSIESIKKLSGEDSLNLSKSMLDRLNDLNDRANDYVVANENKSKNETRQIRFDSCNRLMDILSMDYMNSKYGCLKENQTVVGEGHLVDYPKQIEVEEIEEVDLDKSFYEEKDEETLAKEDQELIDSLTQK